MNDDKPREPPLLPCPFCGSADLRNHHIGGIEPIWWITCRACFTQGPAFSSQQAANDHWNTRAIP